MSDILDYSHSGFMAGFDLGFAQGSRFADEDRARAILHDYAVRMTGLAVSTARKRHGEAWASLIREGAES